VLFSSLWPVGFPRKKFQVAVLKLVIATVPVSLTIIFIIFVVFSCTLLRFCITSSSCGALLQRAPSALLFYCSVLISVLFYSAIYI
jgi:hypothetical protein